MAPNFSPWLPLVDVVNGGPPDLATHFRFCITPASAASLPCMHLEIEADCDVLWTPHVERNAPIYEADALEVFLDPFGGGRIYRELEVAPSGAMFDAWVFNRTDLQRPSSPRRLDLCFPRQQPASPHIETRIDGHRPTRADLAALRHGRPASRWTAALTIPFDASRRGPETLAREVRDPSKPKHAGALRHCSEPALWRINVFRVRHRGPGSRAHLQAWQPTGRLDFHRPEAFSLLPRPSTD